MCPKNTLMHIHEFSDSLKPIKQQKSQSEQEALSDSFDLSDSLDPRGLIHREYLEALDREFLTQPELQFGATGAGPTKELCEGGPMRRTAAGSQSVAQYHPYNPPSVKPHPLSRPYNSTPPRDLAQQSELSRALFPNVPKPSTGQQAPGAVWLPAHDYWALCVMGGVQISAAQVPNTTLLSAGAHQLIGSQQPPTGMQAGRAQQLIASQQPMQSLIHKQLHQHSDRHQQPTLQPKKVQSSSEGTLNSLLRAQAQPTNDGGRASSQKVLSAYVPRSFEETSEFLDQVEKEVLPRPHSAYECMYCGQAKKTAALGGPGECCCACLPQPAFFLSF